MRTDFDSDQLPAPVKRLIRLMFFTVGIGWTASTASYAYTQIYLQYDMALWQIGAVSVAVSSVFALVLAIAGLLVVLEYQDSGGK